MFTKSHELTKKENGNPKILYHGTSILNNFENFKNNIIYFTDNIRTAKDFSEDSTFEKIREIQKKYQNYDFSNYYDENGYLKINIIEAQIFLLNPLIIDCENNFWDSIKTPTEMGGKGFKTTDQITKFAKKNGYDGVIFKNIIDGSNYLSETHYVVFDNKQIKVLNKKIKNKNRI